MPAGNITYSSKLAGGCASCGGPLAGLFSWVATPPLFPVLNEPTRPRICLGFSVFSRSFPSVATQTSEFRLTRKPRAATSALQSVITCSVDFSIFFRSPTTKPALFIRLSTSHLSASSRSHHSLNERIDCDRKNSIIAFELITVMVLKYTFISVPATPMPCASTLGNKVKSKTSGLSCGIGWCADEKSEL